MNAVEIEEAVSKLSEAAFDAAEFPFAFLEAFGNKPATIKQLRSGHSNKSDVDGDVLQRNHIHLAASNLGSGKFFRVTLRKPSPARWTAATERRTSSTSTPDSW